MKMHHHGKPLLFILQATLFPCFLSQTTLNCSNEPFQCGNIQHITYPFWGGARSRSCGRPGFGLVCIGNVPMLNISSLSYRVQVIDFDKNTLKIAREDLWNTTCPDQKFLHNTSIDPDLFSYSGEPKDKNVTLYFNCTSSDRITIPNQFRCDGDDFNSTNVFNIGNASSKPGFGITCSKNIFVPINSEAAESLKDPTASSINILQNALATGFSIKWQKDENQFSLPYCNVEMYRSCIASPERRPVLFGPSSAPDHRQGIPPVQSPGYPLERGHGPNSQPGPGYSSHPPGIMLDPGNSSPPMGIIIGAILGIMSTVIVSITIYYCCKRQCSLRVPKQGSSQDIENSLLQHGSLAPKRYKYSEIKKITKSFKDKIGQGGYGSVYKGILSNGCLVAVKVLIETNSNGEEFVNEVTSISRTSHVNIVNLLGFCYDRNKRALVYEFMPNKSLDKFITPNADSRLDLNKLYKIAIGVAKGLAYLHTGCNTRIVHFDIKPQNILLDEDFCPKVSDFGLAKLCKKKESILSLRGARGTIGYIAPEVFSRNFGGASYKSDVYSYGMMVIEMAGARNNVEIEKIQSRENYFSDKIYEEVIFDVTRKLEDFKIEEEDDTTRKMFLVGFWCIQTTPSERPSMSKVVEMLEGSLQSIEIPPKPSLFSHKLTGHECSPSLSAYAEAENSTEVR